MRKPKKFMHTVLNVEPCHLELRLESWVASRIDISAIANRQCPLNHVISDCHNIIQEELSKLLLCPTIDVAKIYF
ncbi:hypothetical protein J3R82DRAFT_2129 [Butyriboletus roseoflavus]|nr:hypothetical protein J3R82DRAFT_3478 [Butyriboletus roseoflavus]KAG8221799.1 hypothetical protein J3R82DRAFT_2129 [Butyriboletus roseoflavus]